MIEEDGAVEGNATKCRQCKSEMHNHTKICSYPKIWGMRFSRLDFDRETNKTTKRQFTCAVPSKFTIYDVALGKQSTYHLVVTTVHDGSADSGHFNAYVRKGMEDDEWYHIEPGHTNRVPSIVTATTASVCATTKIETMFYVREDDTVKEKLEYQFYGIPAGSCRRCGMDLDVHNCPICKKCREDTKMQKFPTNCIHFRGKEDNRYRSCKTCGEPRRDKTTGGTCQECMLSRERIPVPNAMTPPKPIAQPTRDDGAATGETSAKKPLLSVTENASESPRKPPQKRASTKKSPALKKSGLHGKDERRSRCADRARKLRKMLKKDELVIVDDSRECISISTSESLSERNGQEAQTTPFKEPANVENGEHRTPAQASTRSK